MPLFDDLKMLPFDQNFSDIHNIHIIICMICDSYSVHVDAYENLLMHYLLHNNL